jgi:hypothetical protein
MGNTFYCQTRSDEKRYIIQELSFRGHTIWRSEKFWERALTGAVQSAISCHEGVLWDDLEQGPLVDLVISTHNLIFGQIVSLAFTMHELGLEFEEVVYRVQDLCKSFELSEDLCAQVYQSIRTTFEGGQPSETKSPGNQSKISSLVSETVATASIVDQPDASKASTVAETSGDIAALSAFDRAMLS